MLLDPEVIATIKSKRIGWVGQGGEQTIGQVTAGSQRARLLGRPRQKWIDTGSIRTWICWKS